MTYTKTHLHTVLCLFLDSFIVHVPDPIFS